MLLPIKPICRSNRIKKDGTAPIFLQYCYSRTKRSSSSHQYRDLFALGCLTGMRFSDFNSHTKEEIKCIEVMKPKYDWITSHNAHRSFCTNEFLAGTPVELMEVRDCSYFLMPTPIFYVQ